MNHDEQSEMGFLDHLEELRWRLVRCLLAMVIGSAVSFGYIDHILNVLLYPARSTSNPINLQVLSVQGMFLIKWFISFISGFILSLPYLIYQFWRFVAPGLKVGARAPEGTIEAVEKTDHPWLYAVQWHPEQMQQDDIQMTLFKWLVEEAGD